MDKSKLREFFKRLRASQNLEEWQKRSERICQWLLSSEFYKGSKGIAFFHYINKEVNLCPAMAKALAEKEVYLPCTNLRERTLIFRRLFEFSELVEGAFGIPEPPRENSTLAPEDLDLILVPGLAFDRNKERLGYGGGFYDRVLAQTGAIKIGVAFSFQIVHTLPHEPYDQRVDWILTEEGFF
jgi:5-formyltetrahydrofolate cyclo-ligase